MRKQAAIYRKAMADRERKIQEEEAKLQAQRDEEERARAQQEEVLRRKRIPKTCQFCEGSGKCPACDGKGQHVSFYFTAAVDVSAEQRKDHKAYGLKHQGCELCCGLKPGISGKSVQGCGDCMKCGGAGKFCTFHCDLKKSGKDSPRNKKDVKASRNRLMMKKATAVFEELDQDGNGDISLEEAMKVGLSKKAFQKMDKDGSGGLSKEELQRALAREKNDEFNWHFCEHCGGCIDHDRENPFDSDEEGEDAEAKFLAIGNARLLNRGSSILVIPE